MTTPSYVPDEFPGVQGISLSTRLLPNLAQKPATTSDGISRIAVSWASGVKGVPPINEQVNVPDTLYLPANLEVAGTLTVDGQLILAARASPVSFSPPNPAGTNSTTQVMMGLGALGTNPCVYTPLGGGLVLVTVVAYAVEVTVGGISMTVGARYGTGTAPAYGAANQGTAFGPVADPSIKISTAGTNAQIPAVFTAVLSLTANTAYWFDLALASSAGADTVELVGVQMSFAELR